MGREIKWKYEIGQIIKDNKRNITIIDKAIRICNRIKSIENKKYYKYKCNKCGYNEGWIIEGNLLIGNGCSCCGGRTVVKGINDIATTHPNLVKYFVNIEDCYTHTFGSHNKVLCKCPNCGTEKEMYINNICKNGFRCPKCNDGFSYPEKFMLNVLEQLNIIYIYQYTKTNAKWCKNYRYDFYFEYDDEKYIIETHGQQHYKDTTGVFTTLEEQQGIDKIKKELAINNGIKEENYIVIDCEYSKLEYIKQNIINSRLNKIFDLSMIDWVKIGQDSEKSLVKEVCDYWNLHNDINNENISCTELSVIFGMCRSSCRKYLKIGKELGWCNYDKEEELEKAKSRRVIGRNKKSEKIEVIKDSILIGVFDSASELSSLSNKVFGFYLDSTGIRRVCNGKRKTYKGLKFKYA